MADARHRHSRGLGDDIKLLTENIGLDKIADKISEIVNKDCGCSKRQAKLNKLFPYKNKKND